MASALPGGSSLDTLHPRPVAGEGAADGLARWRLRVARLVARGEPGDSRCLPPAPRGRLREALAWTRWQLREARRRGDARRCWLLVGLVDALEDALEGRAIPRARTSR